MFFLALGDFKEISVLMQFSMSLVDDSKHGVEQGTPDTWCLLWFVFVHNPSGNHRARLLEAIHFDWQGMASSVSLLPCPIPRPHQKCALRYPVVGKLEFWWRLS